MATRSWTDLGPADGSSSEAKDPSPPHQQERKTQYPINDIEEAGRTVDEGPLAKRAARVEGAAAKGWRAKQAAKKAAKQAAKQGDGSEGGESKSGKGGKHNHAQQQGKGGKQRITGTTLSITHKSPRSHGSHYIAHFGRLLGPERATRRAGVWSGSQVFGPRDSLRCFGGSPD